MKKIVIIAIMFMLASGVISCVSSVEGKVLPQAMQVVKNVPITPVSVAADVSQKEANASVTGKPGVDKSTIAVGQKSSPSPLKREPLDVKGTIREDRWSPEFKKIWRFEHEFAQDIYQTFGAFTVRVKLTNISEKTLRAGKVAFLGVEWRSQQDETSSWEEVVFLNTIIDPMDYPYAPIKPGQIIILEPFERRAGNQVAQRWQSYEVNLHNGGGSTDEKLLGNFIDGFYRETTSAREKIIATYKAGISPDGKLKAYIETSNFTRAIITGNVFFNWLDDKMNPLGKTEVRKYSTKELPYYLLSSSEGSEAARNFEFSIALNSKAKSYEFWIELTDGK